MPGPESIGWNPYGPEIGPVYQSEPKLGSEPRPVYESKHKIGSGLGFLLVGTSV